MKIMIFSSMTFAKEYSEIGKQIEKIWHEVLLPPWTEEFIKWERHNNRNDSKEILEYARQEELEFLDTMKDVDGVLVTNYEKNNIKWYIWGSVLMEMSIAFYLRKPIFVLNELPKESDLRYVQEIAIMKPQIIHNDFTKITL